MLTKKHFEAITNILKNNLIAQSDDNDWFLSQNTVNDLASYLAKENPAFDKEKFLKAIKGD